VPAGQNPRIEGMEVIEVRELTQAIEIAFPSRDPISITPSPQGGGR
jgi:hypothetical protein